MVRDDILGGIELALSKGESLEQAMQTFFNAGYKREEVEEAASIIQGTIENVQIPTQVIQPQQQIQQVQPQPIEIQPSQVQQPPIVEEPKTVEIQIPQVIPPTQPQFVEEPKIVEVQPAPIELEQQPQKQKPVQKVSAYGKEKVSARTIIIISLSIILFVLLTSLISTLLFRGFLLEFFNNFFG